MSQPFMFPSISSIFFSARSIWSWFFFSMFVLFLGWLGGCSNYFFIRWVLDTSHTPRIISSLVEITQNGIQHGSFLEVPPKCPNLSCFPLFLPSSFQQEVFGCECFFHVCSVSGLVGWLWQLNSYSKGPDISHTPKVFSCVEISHTVGWNGNERQGARSVWFGCHWFFHIFRFPFMYPPSLFYIWILIFPSVSFLGTGLLMSPHLAGTLVPLLLRKADRLQRGATEGLAEIWILRARTDWLS